jgi:hypothetical protein
MTALANGQGANQGGTVSITFGHVNIIAKDWRKPSEFYQTVFACIPVPPVRKQSGPALLNCSPGQIRHKLAAALRPDSTIWATGNARTPG